MRTIYPLASQQLIHPSATLHTSHNVTPRGKKLIDDTRLSFIKVSDPKIASSIDLTTEVKALADCRIYAEEFFIHTISPRAQPIDHIRSEQKPTKTNKRELSLNSDYKIKVQTTPRRRHILVDGSIDI